MNLNQKDRAMTKLYKEIINGISPSLAKLRKEIPDVMSAFSSLAQSATKDGALNKKTNDAQKTADKLKRENDNLKNTIKNLEEEMVSIKDDYEKMNLDGPREEEEDEEKVKEAFGGPRPSLFDTNKIMECKFRILW